MIVTRQYLHPDIEPYIIMNTKTKLSLFPSLLIISFLISCSGNKDQKAAAAGPGAANPNPVKDYPVITVTQRTTVLNTDYPATIQGQQNIEIRPKIDGYIQTIYVDEGSTVKKGQPLFRINAPQYEQEVRTAQANIKIAQAEVDAAQMQVNKGSPAC